jgi:glutamate carboxypeptidase
MFAKRSSILITCFATVFMNAQNLTKQEGEVARLIDQDAPAAIQVLERLVNINSGTYNPAGVIAVDKQVESQLQLLGFNTRWINMDSVQRAPHLVAERKGNRGKRILLIGHADTVFEPSSPFQRFERQGNVASAPGGADMKGGLVVMLSALKALHAVGALRTAPLPSFWPATKRTQGSRLRSPART